MIRAIDNKVILEVANEESKTTASGLFIPTSETSEKIGQYKVLSVGPLVTEVQEGDTVLIPKDKVWNAHNETLLFTTAHNIVAIIE